MSRRAEIRLASLSLLAAAAVLAAPPAAAQFSDSYSFLQAVEKRDGDKATSLLTDNDTRVINTRNPDTGETALAIVVKRRDLTWRSEENTSELQSIMRSSYDAFCLKKK